jgi:hypothetical protein
MAVLRTRKHENMWKKELAQRKNRCYNPFVPFPEDYMTSLVMAQVGRPSVIQHL